MMIREKQTVSRRPRVSPPQSKPRPPSARTASTTAPARDAEPPKPTPKNGVRGRGNGSGIGNGNVKRQPQSNQTQQRTRSSNGDKKRANKPKAEVVADDRPEIDAVNESAEKPELEVSMASSGYSDSVPSESASVSASVSAVIPATTTTPSATPALLRRQISGGSTVTVADPEEVRRLRAQLQSMKEQVYFLHKMMQGLSQPEKQMLKGKHLQQPNKRLSFAGISPVKKAGGRVDIIVMPDERADKWRLPTTHEFRQSFAEVEFAPNQLPSGESSSSHNEMLTKLRALEQENAALKKQIDASAEEYSFNVEDLTSKVAILEAENSQFRSNIEEFEEENLRLHSALAQVAKENERNLDESINNQGEIDEINDAEANVDAEVDSELGIDDLGEDEQDEHARCEEKIHELWQTIKTLKTYVETFRVEIEDLKIQRDHAIETAERAWEENVKLAGSNNPQQRIKYLEAVKKENAELVQKVRELQSRLTKKQLSGLAGESGRSKHSSGDGSEPHEDYPSIPESGEAHSDDGSEAERTQLLKKMWARNKKLEEEIDRLRKEKQLLMMREPRSRSVDSRQSSTKSSSSRWKS